MADNHHSHAPAPGGMDISEQQKTYLAFWNTSKWSTIALIILAALLAIFRTHNGY